MSNRITIMLDDKSLEKARKRQIELIKQGVSSPSLSQAIRHIIMESK